ncbi:hypothetical protein K438DRAFT_1921249 [Mycena galopus ATCC 62051]|nr:hypothetical protein K438DRAFT_1921249 [Mycena galopus ATCC 62051]
MSVYSPINRALRLNGPHMVHPDAMHMRLQTAPPEHDAPSRPLHLPLRSRDPPDSDRPAAVPAIRIFFIGAPGRTAESGA